MTFVPSKTQPGVKRRGGYGRSKEHHAKRTAKAAAGRKRYVISSRQLAESFARALSQ